MINWLLDTDHLTLLQRGGGTALPLQLRLAEFPASEFATTIINYEEQMRQRPPRKRGGLSLAR